MEATTYNGWSNYETWAVGLWLDNEQGTYHFARTLARIAHREAGRSQAVKDWGWSLEDAAVWQLAKMLRDFIDDHDPTPTATLYADLMHAALSEVNWREIARHYLDEVTNEEEQQGRMKHDEEPQMEHSTSGE
jgi:hypothetical protein